MAKTFAASIAEFVDKTEENLNAVFKQSAYEIFEIAQTPKGSGGRMPIDTGILRASLHIAVNAQDVANGPTSYVVILNQAQFGDTIRGEYRGVNYALRQEFGFVGTDSLGRTYNQQGNFFVGNAAAQWQNIVNKNARLAAERQRQ
jgi:hypothetical protein